MNVRVGEKEESDFRFGVGGTESVFRFMVWVEFDGGGSTKEREIVEFVGEGDGWRWRREHL